MPRKNCPYCGSKLSLEAQEHIKELRSKGGKKSAETRLKGLSKKEISAEMSALGKRGGRPKKPHEI